RVPLPSLLLVHRRLVDVCPAKTLRLRVVALLDDLDLHRYLPLTLAGDGVRQRDDGRIETVLVTCRRVHVAKLTVRRRDAPSGTDRDVRAVAAFLPWRQPEKPLARALPP